MLGIHEAADASPFVIALIERDQRLKNCASAGDAGGEYHVQDMGRIDDLFRALARSRFRSRFRLGPAEYEYLGRKGSASILDHARQFVRQRLAPAQPRNDGRQTPMRGHPVFIAQHATATCCRSCLHKWHHIPTGKPLTARQIDHIIEVIECWLNAQRQMPSDDTADAKNSVRSYLQSRR